MDAAEAALFGATVKDLLTMPRRLVVETPELSVQRIGRKFDILAYLRQDTTAAHVLKRYRFEGTTRGLGVWIRD